MKQPEVIRFTDLEVSTRELLRLNQQGPMNLSWTRVQFIVPDSWDAVKKVQEWLKENCPGEWSSYNFQHPKSKKSGEYTMVVRFEDNNDALMFKLRGGHQAWQIS
jgi:hypothetical protein